MNENTPRSPFRVEFGEQFPEPPALPEAIVRKETLLLEIQSIQDQLGEFKEPGGPKPPASDEFAFWRRRARKALNIKHAQHRLLKQWIQDHQMAEDGRPLTRVLHLLNCWMEQFDINPTPPERDLLNSAAEHVGLELTYA